MNEKIRELAEQAGLRFTMLTSNPMIPFVDGRQQDLEKFAELIVKECLSLSSDLNPSEAMDAAHASSKSQYGSAALLRVYDNTVDQYYDAIKIHFGVEE